MFRGTAEINGVPPWRFPAPNGMRSSCSNSWLPCGAEGSSDLRRSWKKVRLCGPGRGSFRFSRWELPELRRLHRLEDETLSGDVSSCRCFRSTKRQVCNGCCFLVMLDDLDAN